MMTLSHWGMFKLLPQPFGLPGFKLAWPACLDQSGAIVQMIPLKHGEPQPFYLRRRFTDSE